MIAPSSVDKIFRRARRIPSCEAVANDRLDAVRSLARGYAGRGLHPEDLAQEGIAAVLVVEGRSCPTGGRPLSAGEALRLARRAMERAVEAHGTAVRLPLRAREKAHRLLDARDALTSELGREPEAAELAHRMGPSWRPEDVVEALNAGISMGVLDPEAQERDPCVASPSGEREAGEERDEDAPEEVAVRRAMAARLREELAILPETERRVLAERYGLDGGTPKPLSALARSLGLSEYRVGRIQRSAQRRLAGRISRPRRPETA